jgi:transposase, IS30 family
MEKPKKYEGLNDAERSEIEILRSEKYSIRKIAIVLGRSPNTISREIRVNSVDGVYVAKKAKAKSRVSRRSRRYQWQKIEHYPKLWQFVIERLAPPYDWSPKAIAGYLKNEQTKLPYVSTTQIYAWLYSSRGQPYCECLYSKRYHPRRRKKNKTERAMIPDRISVAERPETVLNRIEPGHCEFDSIVSSKRSRSTFALAVVQERTSRLVRARLVPNLKPEPYSKTILRLTHNLKVCTMTTDNGIENKHHRFITEATGTKVYFTDPYASWQKGGVENANKMIRRYFPKGTDFSTVSQYEVDEAVRRINNKPRQSLGYKSALQCALEKGVLVEGVS